MFVQRMLKDPAFASKVKEQQAYAASKGQNADPNVVDNEGETLLGWCARNDCPFMVRKLLRDFDGTYGPKVDPSIEDRTYRRTPLDWCTLQEDAPPGEGPAPFRPACAIALVEGGAPVAQRGDALDPTTPRPSERRR